MNKFYYLSVFIDKYWSGKDFQFSILLTKLKVHAYSITVEMHIFIIVIYITLIFIATINVLTGQLYLDYKSMQVAKFLMREVSQKEEKKANWWIKKLRIIKWRGKLVLIIPCAGTGSVVSTIQKRCDLSLLSWLNDNFPSINWMPQNIKNNGFITWVITYEK